MDEKGIREIRAKILEAIDKNTDWAFADNEDSGFEYETMNKDGLAWDLRADFYKRT